MALGLKRFYTPKLIHKNCYASQPSAPPSEPDQPKYIFVTNPPIGPEPVPVVCPNCHMSVVSIIDHNVSAKTHLCCMILSSLGCCLCAPCVYCTKDWLSKEHWCPNCKKYLGTYDG